MELKRKNENTRKEYGVDDEVINEVVESVDFSIIQDGAEVGSASIYSSSLNLNVSFTEGNLETMRSKLVEFFKVIAQ